MSRDVLTAADLPLLRDGVIVANAGHFPAEIDAEGLIGAGEVAASRQYADDLLTLELTDGRRVHLVSRGHMFNLAGPRPLGNSIESMDLGFALQARCPEAVATGAVDAASCGPGSRGHRHRRRHQLSRPEVPAAIASS